MTDIFKVITGDGEVRDINNVIVRLMGKGEHNQSEELSINILNNRISKLGVSIEKTEKEIVKQENIIRECKGYVSLYNKLLPLVGAEVGKVKLKK